MITHISPWHDRDFGELTFQTAQMFTGHGNFRAYLARIGKSQSDICLHCASVEVDDVIHTVLRCDALSEERGCLATLLSIKEVVKKMLSSEANWQAATSLVDRLMIKKEKLDRERGI